MRGEPRRLVDDDELVILEEQPRDRRVDLRVRHGPIGEETLTPANGG